VRSRGIWLFGDEAYRPLGPTGAIHLPQVADVYERGISLGVLSKAYGLPGLRIGWLACADRAMLQRFEQAKHYLSICNSGPSERLAVIALGARHALLARNCGLVSRNLERLDGFFAERPGPVRLASTRRGLRRFPALPRAPRASRLLSAGCWTRPGSCCCPPASFDRSSGRPRKTGSESDLAATACRPAGGVRPAVGSASSLIALLCVPRSSDETARQSKGVAILLRALS